MERVINEEAGEPSATVGGEPVGGTTDTLEAGGFKQTDIGGSLIFVGGAPESPQT